MVGYFSCWFGRAGVCERGEVGDAEDIYDELGQLEGAACQRRNPISQGRFVMEELGVEDAHHAGAGARRNYHVPVALEYVDCAAGEGLGVGPEARIEGGLAAAGLRRREVQVHAEPLQYVHGTFTDFGIELVDDAGYEEGRPDRW